MHHVHYDISSPVPSSPSAVLHYPAAGENNMEKVLCWHSDMEYELYIHSRREMLMEG